MKRLLKNGGGMMVAQFITVLISFFSRKIFLMFLSVEFLGYESVFSNVLTLLSVADLGLETVIISKLYHAVAIHDEEEAGKLLYIFKWFYRIVSAIVLIAAVIIAPFLPYIIRDASTSWDYLYIVYTMQIFAVIVGYFLSYRRAIFIADQKGSICTLCDMIGKIITQIAQIIVLVIYPNYLAYLLCRLCTAPLANILLKFRCDILYPFTKRNIKITRADINEFNLLSEGKSYFIHKICALIFNATDTIVISAFCGVVLAAMYSNYLSLVMAFTGLLISVPFQALQAAIGNRIQKCSSETQRQEEMEAFFLASGIYSIQIGLGIFIFIQFAMMVWLGNQYLLPTSVAFLFSFIRAIVAMDYANGCYRNPAGDFYKDKNYIVLAAFVNIVLSVLFAGKMGIEGVLLGTLVGQFITNFSHVKVVVQKYSIPEKATSFTVRQTIWPVLLLLEMGMAYYIFKDKLGIVSLPSLILKVVVWGAFGAANFLILWFFPGHKEFRRYCKRFFRAMLHDIKKQEKYGK